MTHVRVSLVIEKLKNNLLGLLSDGNVLNNVNRKRIAFTHANKVRI